ncbi:MAG: HD domain-containing protein [Spirochaetales bacterium]|jgi:HD-GYP domain-containing protein (c-di-GMP phosphodiesterase class II)|nr:HD domain-containing protein [Spirochaetales bacterium]
MRKPKYIVVRRSHLKYYTDIELFYKTQSGNLLLYKPKGMPFTEDMASSKPFLGDLYIREEDKMASIEAAQKGFNEQLVHDIRSKDLTEVREALSSIVDETLSAPRSGGLRAMSQTAQVVVTGFSTQTGIIKNLVRIAFSDYTTTIHSINVMALMVGYCYYVKKSEKVTHQWALAALLHDVGKTEIPKEILNAQRVLSNEEFETIKKHPAIGADILNGYTEQDIRSVIPGVVEHHEKLDGTGYPNGIANISECGKILGIIDCYEAITNDDRPYRSAMEPLNALKYLKEEVDKDKFDRESFSNFAYSLAVH